MRQRAASWTAPLLSLWLSALPVSAQVGERGRITTRSEVKMSIEGVAGTSGAKLEALAKTLSTPLTSIKQCYGELVKEHPEVVGSLGVELELPATGKLQVRAPGAVRELKPMQSCVDKAFAKLDVSAVPRPAGARVSLALTNSAASSVGEVRKREEDATRVEVEPQPDGSFRSRGKSMQGELSFEVTGRDKSAVERLHNELRDALPGLFDCRRRASKNGSPEGRLVFAVAKGGTVTVKSSSVPNERAPTCAAGALKRSLKTKSIAELTIDFAP